MCELCVKVDRNASSDWVSGVTVILLHFLFLIIRIALIRVACHPLSWGGASVIALIDYGCTTWPFYSFLFHEDMTGQLHIFSLLNSLNHKVIFNPCIQQIDRFRTFLSLVISALNCTKWALWLLYFFSRFIYL